LANIAIARAYTKDRLEQESIDDIEVTSEYLAVKRLLELGISPVLVMGKAGTGKSTLIRYLKGVFSSKNIVVVAPTGVAALNAKGVTINSFFRFPPTLIQQQDIVTVSGRNLYKHIDILIIDEISMVRADLLDGINWFLNKNGKKDNCLFGGTQVVMLGDVFQLPPVVTRDEGRALTALGYQSPFFFSAKCLSAVNIVPIELTRIYRQCDADFIDLLNKIRIAEDSDHVVRNLNGRCFGRPPIPNAVTLATTNAIVDAKNDLELAKLPAPDHVFVGQAQGTFAIEDARLPSPMRLVLKPGAQVMFTKNDEAKRWVNGSLGRVLSIDGSIIRVELLTDRPGNVCEVSVVSWKNYAYRLDSGSSRIETNVTGQYQQFPLMLAWAVTIHKAQGKTLDRVHIDFGHGTFDSGQAYVAFSRCKSWQGITLERPVRNEDITCSQVLKLFNEGVASQIPDIADLASQTSSWPDVDGDYNVVGLHYGECNKKDLIPQLDSVVLLVADPTNPYDQNAVRVEWSGHLVGHIPRSCNRELSRLLQRGVPLLAIVNHVSSSASEELLAMTIKVKGVADVSHQKGCVE